MLNSKVFYSALGLWLITIGLSTAADAHHSFAMFDQKKLSAIKGTINKVDWRNPHAYVEIFVGEGAKVKKYIFECRSPNELSQWGWKRDSVKAGEKVTVQFFPFRSVNSNGGMVYSLTQANGRVLKAN
jgi:hypothetical protein